MRKTTKSILSLVMSAAMVLTLGSGVTIFDGTKSASADEASAQQISTPFSLTVRQSNSGIYNWTYDANKEAHPEWNDNDNFNELASVSTSVAIETTGEYSISTIAGDDIDGVEDIGGGIWVASDLTKIPTDFTVKPTTMVVKHEDGTEDTYDWSKASLYNDGLRETGEVRIGVVNHYVGTTSSKVAEYTLANPFESNVNGTWAANEPIPIVEGDEVIYNVSVTAEAPTVTATPVPTAVPTAPPALKEYNAYLGFQTDNYSFRNPWNDELYGINGKGDKNGKLDNYKTQVGYWDGDALKAATANFTDAVIKENTTYTVSMSGVNLQTLKGSAASATNSTCFNALFVSTDIPVAMKGVTATASLSIDGKVIKSNFAIPTNTEADYYEFYISDLYSDTHKTEPTVAYPKASLLKVLPTSSVEITFTVKGVQFEGDFSTKTVGLAKGKTFSKGNFKYKVSTASTETLGKKTTGKVQLTGLSAAGKKKTSVSVPAKVTNSGATYTVSTMKASAFAKATKLKKITFKKATNLKALSSKAFYKATKLQTVVLGKKMKKLPANVFGGCKNLKTLTINAKLGTVNKKAFTGCKKKITIKGTSKKANLKKIKKVYKKAK